MRPLEGETAEPGRASSPGECATAQGDRAAAPARAAQRLAIVAPGAALVLDLLPGLIREAVAHRHKVAVVTGEASAREAALLTSLGAEVRRVDLDPPGLAFLSSRRAASAVYGALADFEPHAVLAAGRRAGALGALAARRLATRRIVMLPATVSAGGRDETASHRALAAAHAFVFLNEDDRIEAERRNLLPRGAPAAVLALPGIDLAAHARLPLAEAGPVTFLLLGTPSSPAATAAFLAAGRALRERAPDVRFAVAHEAGSGPEAGALGAAFRAGEVTDAGDLEKASGAIASAHVVLSLSETTLPQRYAIEALAAGRALILVDVAGARALIDERVNGALVTPGDTAGLLEAMSGFLKHPDLLRAAARASRCKAERLFSGEPPQRTLLAVLELT